MKGSFDFLKLQDTNLIEQSDDPIATTEELGWKVKEIIGDLVNFYLKETVQQFDSMLKNPIAIERHDEPNPNFFPLGAHLEQRIDNLISILTSIFSHLLLLTLLKIKTLLSWLPVIILSSLDQSISEIV